MRLVLDIIWADVPLITEGAGVDVWRPDDSASQKWHMIPAN